jgi:opacity protein-like surface antigen
MVSLSKYIIGVFIIILSSQAKADWYFKGGLGLNTIKNTKFSNKDFEGKVNLINTFPLIEAGFGYKFDNGIRLESVIDYYFVFKTNENSLNKNLDTLNINKKVKADTLMLNAYKDILTIDNFTPFIGGGVGIGYLHETSSGKITSSDDNTIHNLENISKKINQFTYKLSTGVSIKMNEYSNLEITYNYFNLGANKKKANINNPVCNYELYNVTLGMRFSL